MGDQSEVELDENREEDSLKLFAIGVQTLLNVLLEEAIRLGVMIGMVPVVDRHQLINGVRKTTFSDTQPNGVLDSQHLVDCKLSELSTMSEILHCLILLNLHQSLTIKSLTLSLALACSASFSSLSSR